MTDEPPRGNPGAGRAPSPTLRLRENLYLVDYGILGLAFTSVVVFLLYQAKLVGVEFTALRTVDFALVTLYAAAFATKWVLAEQPVRWLRRNAINAIGVLPLTMPLLVPERFFIVVQLVIVVLRAGEAMDRAFGARVLRGLIERYQYMLVEALTDPILMRLAVVLEDTVTSRDYAAAMGKKLDERRDLVEAAVQRAIAASPKLSRLSQFGPVDRYIKETTEELVDAAHAALTGPEVNTIIRESLQEAFGELKDGIRQRRWVGKGVGVGDLARAVRT